MFYKSRKIQQWNGDEHKDELKHDTDTEYWEIETTLLLHICTKLNKESLKIGCCWCLSSSDYVLDAAASCEGTDVGSDDHTSEGMPG